MLELKINGAAYDVSTLEQLRLHLAEVQRTQFAEVWLEEKDSWPTICALIHGDAAWLMYTRYEGDAGFSTRNPDYSGPADATIEYHLTNGQRDEYPAAWNITTAEALRALEYFLKEKNMAPWLSWHDESAKAKKRG